MTQKYDDLFDRELSEFSDEELLELANKVKTARNYPSVKTKKKEDPIDKLVNEVLLQGKDDEKDSDSDNSSE